MGKKIIITEKQFQKILSEELGIADKVVCISKIIEKKIFTSIEQNHSITFKANDLNIVFKIHNFNTIEELYKKYSSNEILDGYSYSENTLYLSYIKLNGYPKYEQMDAIKSTIQHEVEHYWQSKNAKKSLSTTQYQHIVNGLYSNNLIISTICKIIYYSKHIEIDAHVNGAYNQSKEKNILSFDEFIEKTDLFQLFKTFKENEKSIDKWNYESYYFYDAVKYIKQTNILKFNTIQELISKLKDILLKSKKYLIRKTARAYTLYVKNNEINNMSIDEEINRWLNNSLYKTIKPRIKPYFSENSKYI